MVFSVTSSMISFFGEGKSIFSIKKNEKSITKNARSIFTIILTKDVLLFDLCNLCCIVNKIYLNLKNKTNL